MKTAGGGVDPLVGSGWWAPGPGTVPMGNATAGEA